MVGKEKIQLSALSKGQAGKILSVEDSDLEFALSTMGLIPGDHFRLTDIAPLNGPMALEINGSKIALRKQEASKVWVKINE